MPAKKSIRVLSSVPQQTYTFEDKLNWVEQQIRKHAPDVIVLPQEYPGGIQCELFKEQLAKIESGP